MNNLTKINGNIHRLTIPYKDIFTTVYLIKTPIGAILFDVASTDEEIRNIYNNSNNILTVKTGVIAAMRTALKDGRFK